MLPYALKEWISSGREQTKKCINLTHQCQVDLGFFDHNHRIIKPILVWIDSMYDSSLIMSK